jgi:hypothetical protein
MTRLGRMSGAGALMLLALGCAAPVGAAVPSATEADTRAPAIAGEAPAAAESEAEANARRFAVNACVQSNEFGPARLVQAVGDGFGDWLVWVEDREGDLWSCNADGEGHVYLNVVVAGDLLEGRGAEFLRTEPTLATANAPAHGEEASRDLCVAVAGLTQAVTVLTTVPDGMGDNLVWMRLADGQLWMCNASSDGRLFVFEPVGGPTQSSDDAGTLAAEVPGS